MGPKTPRATDLTKQSDQHKGKGLCHIATGPDKIHVEFHCKSPPAEPGMGAQYTCDQCLASGALGPGGKYTKVVKELESPLCIQTHVFIITVKLINACVFIHLLFSFVHRALSEVPKIQR